MWSYLLPIAVLAVCIYLYDTGRTERFRNWAFLLIGLYITLLYGLRDLIGHDTLFMYSPVYESFPTFATYQGSDKTPFASFAPGFRLIYLLFKSIGSPFWCVQLFINVCINAMFLYFIAHYIKPRFTALMLYFVCVSLFYNTEILRQALSIGIFMLSFRAIEQRKWWLYYLYVAIAWMFHNSAVVLLFVPLLYILRVRLNLTLILYIILLSIVYVIIYWGLPYVMQLFGETYGDKIHEYAMTYNERYNIKYFIYHILLITAIPAAVMTYYKYVRRCGIPFEPLVCALLLIAPGVVPFGEAFLRLSTFFVPYFLFSMAICIGNDLRDNEKRLRYVAVAMLILIMGCYMHQTIKSFRISREYNPYRSVIMSEEKPDQNLINQTDHVK